MIRPIVAIFDLIHLAANIAFFVAGFSVKLTPVAAFVYMPLVLLAIWAVFFGFRSYLISQQKSHKNKKLIKTQAPKNSLTPVLES